MANDTPPLHAHLGILFCPSVFVPVPFIVINAMLIRYGTVAFIAFAVVFLVIFAIFAVVAGIFHRRHIRQNKQVLDATVRLTVVFLSHFGEAYGLTPKKTPLISLAFGATNV